MSFSAEETLFMQRALELAQLGLGQTATNPLVGCVIVNKGKVIGEGYHKKYGGPHAEVEAVRSVKNIGELRDATVYVTLEPCAHYGKTPPCALLLKELPIKEVVIAIKDPFPEVHGQGIQILREAGKKVRVGLLENEARFQNRRFLTRLEENRPYIILKWAESANGIIGRNTGEPLKISSELNKILVHKWRAEESAILVGANTFIQDKPKLDVRYWSGPNPKRVVFSFNNQVAEYLPANEENELWVLNTKHSGKKGLVEFFKIDSEKPAEFLIKAMQLLSEDLKIASVLVEGGSQLHNTFIEAGLWDEVRILKSKTALNELNPVFAPSWPDSKPQIVETGGDFLYQWFRQNQTI